jgi:glycosyltransferase involved in cell wall biosynthesis
MKILYVYEKYPDRYLRYLDELLKHIKKSNSIKSLVYSFSDQADYVIKSYGLLDKIYRFLHRINLSKANSLDMQIMQKFDIVHVQMSFLYPKILPLLSIKKRPKIVITLRGGDTYVKPWLTDIWRDFYKLNGNKIDSFITMSQNQKEYLMRWGIEEKKISVIPISFGTFSNADPKYPNKGKMKIVSAYRMTWEKNIEGSIRFARALKDKNIDFQYDVYGDGNDLGQLYYLIDKFQLNDSINVMGRIDNELLKEKLSEYDFFLQISQSDALPTSVIEAQSMGLPCIVSKSDGLPEAVINDETAIVEDYFEINKMVDESISLWRNADLYFSYSKNSIENANTNFTIEKEIERLNVLYNSLYN